MDNFIPGNIDSRLIKASLNGASASAASANNNLVAPARNAFNIQRNSQGQLVNTETGRTVSPQDLNNEIASLNRVLSTTLGTNLDTYIQNNTKLSGNRRSYEVTNNIQLSTNTKFAIFAYSHLRLLAFYAGGSEDFSHTSLSARATAYQTTITSSEEITAIASANYQTLLNIAMSMINEASTNLENVAKVLLFAIKGSSYVQKDAVKTILGSGYDSLPLVDTYPGNSSDPRAFELLDQIVKLMITAGDNTRLLYSTGYTVANILNNNSIVNTDSDPLQNIKDIYASADAVAGNRNWLNPGIALNDPNAAQKAWDFYGQAESVLGLISPAGVSWPASASLSRELSVKKNQITSAASGFFNTFKLARAAELIAANNYSAFSLEELKTIRAELAKHAFNPYRDFFNQTFTLPGSAAVLGALSRLERELGSTANSRAAVTVRWDAILAKLESRAAQQATAAAEAEQVRLQVITDNKTDLGAAEQQFRTAADILAKIDSPPGNGNGNGDENKSGRSQTVGAAADAAKTAADDQTQLSAALTAARDAASAVDLNPDNTLNGLSRTARDGERVKKLAEAVLAESRRKETAAAEAAAQAKTIKTNNTTALQKTRDNFNSAGTISAAIDAKPNTPPDTLTAALKAAADSAQTALTAVEADAPGDTITVAFDGAKAAAAMAGLNPDTLLRNVRTNTDQEKAAAAQRLSAETLRELQRRQKIIEADGIGISARAAAAEQQRDLAAEAKRSATAANREQSIAAILSAAGAADTAATDAEWPAGKAPGSSDSAKSAKADAEAARARRAATIASLYHQAAQAEQAREKALAAEKDVSTAAEAGNQEEVERLLNELDSAVTTAANALEAAEAARDKIINDPTSSSSDKDTANQEYSYAQQDERSAREAQARANGVKTEHEHKRDAREKLNAIKGVYAETLDNLRRIQPPPDEEIRKTQEVIDALDKAIADPSPANEAAARKAAEAAAAALNSDIRDIGGSDLERLAAIADSLKKIAEERVNKTRSGGTGERQRPRLESKF